MIRNSSRAERLKARILSLRKEILLLPTEIEKLEGELEDYADERRRRFRMRRKLKTPTSRRSDADFRIEACLQEKAFRQQDRITKKLTRKRARLLAAKGELRELIFEMAMIPVSYWDNAFIAQKEGENEDIYHIFIGKRNERVSGILHGHIVVDLDGFIHYARWPGEKRGKEHFVGAVPAEEYYEIYNSLPENSGSELSFEIEYSKYIDFRFPIPEEELEIPEIIGTFQAVNA